MLGIWFLQNIKLFFQRSRTLDRPHDSGDILSYAIIILCLKKLFKTDVGIYYEIIDASKRGGIVYHSNSLVLVIHKPK